MANMWTSEDQRDAEDAIGYALRGTGSITIEKGIVIKKDTNPKDAVGTGKVPISTVPLPVLYEVGLAMLEGARKYGRHNYRVAGVRASVYFDALWRHIGAWWEGEDIDAKSGLHHIAKAIATLMVLRDSQIAGNWVDDRPPIIIDSKFWDDVNVHAANLVASIENPVPAYTQKERKNEDG